MPTETKQSWMIAIFPAVVMSLGWGFRGFIGGGPLGAMIPGAMVAMSISLLLDRQQTGCAMAAAFGAVGIGLGGQMTYGQTVGFIIDPETFSWGLAGLTLKGAVWGLSGGAIVGTAFAGASRRRASVIVALVLMMGGTYLGWKLVNEPKLLYFSHPLDKPRPEIWAGLLLGGLLYLGYLARAGLGLIPARFALYGTIGGGFGFGLGGALQALGLGLPVDHQWYPWWKLMEFTFGFFFGLALGICAYRNHRALVFDGPGRPGKSQPLWTSFLAATLLLIAILWVEPNLPGRFSYSVIGAALLVVALYSGILSWHIAITLTITAFAADLAEYFYQQRGLTGPAVAWSFVLLSFVSTLAVVGWRQASGRTWLPWAFLLLLWTALADSLVKAALHPRPYTGVLMEQLAFLVGAALLLWLFRGWQNLRRSV
jgi:hypothetical protein